MVGGHSPPREREYLFIDGGCLRSATAKICEDIFGDKDAYKPFLPGIANSQFDKVFYYDAISGRDHGESQLSYETRVQAEHERFDEIQALDRVHVSLGDIVGKKRRQKGVDVQLTVDMMTHAFRGNITRATLFAGDADFAPLLRALVGQGLHVTLWHPPQANFELKGAADSIRLFNFRDNHRAFTLNGIQSAFQHQSSGNGDNPENHGLSNIWMEGEFRFAGSWKDGVLQIWRSDSTLTWQYQTLLAPSATVTRALVAFDNIHLWGISGTAEQWIHT